MKDHPTKMRAIAPDLLGLIGLALLAYGAWRAWPPAGFMVGGLGLIVLALVASLAERPAPAERPEE
jgi:hypothetical protein